MPWRTKVRPSHERYTRSRRLKGTRTQSAQEQQKKIYKKNVRPSVRFNLFFHFCLFFPSQSKWTSVAHDCLWFPSRLVRWRCNDKLNHVAVERTIYERFVWFAYLFSTLSALSQVKFSTSEFSPSLGIITVINIAGETYAGYRSLRGTYTILGHMYQDRKHARSCQLRCQSYQSLSSICCYLCSLFLV